MKWRITINQIRQLALLVALGVLSLNVNAAALFTMSGDADDAKSPSQAQVRLSLINWNTTEEAKAIVDEFTRYEKEGDAQAFTSYLEGLNTKGYVFSAASTGYSIKYAWQDQTADDKRYVFLVVPGLKTRNPYLWNTPNKDNKMFSLLELRFEGDEAIAKTSLSTDIAVGKGGNNLELAAFDATKLFARMQDDTPYYLK